MENKNRIKLIILSAILLAVFSVIIIDVFQNRIEPSAYEEALYYRTTVQTVVRNVPNAGGKVIGTKSAGEKLQVISAQNGWLKITYGQNEGYVSMECVEPYIPTLPEDLNDEVSIEAAKTVFELINYHRAEIGRQPLLWNDELYAAALVRAKENVFVAGHTRPDGRIGYSAVSDIGINNVLRGEDVARYANSVDIIYNGWYESPAHRRSIERERYRQGAVGVWIDETGSFFTVLLMTN